MSKIQDRTFFARLDCHYLLHTPDVVDAHTLLVVTLHGFGANPGAMVQPTSRLFDGQPVIASLQGPNQFFLRDGARDVGYGWKTSRRPEESIRLHQDMVLHVADEAGAHFGIPRERRLLVGFSQSVALNYRFVASYPDAVRGVIGICGGLPGDWEDAAYQPVTAAVLHIARSGDEYYPPSATDCEKPTSSRRSRGMPKCTPASSATCETIS
jgi:predicted esterase